MTIVIGFHHCSGGDSLLPAKNRGFFDGYTVELDVSDVETLKQVCDRAMDAVYAMRETEHPDWVDRAVEDLAPEIWFLGDLWEPVDEGSNRPLVAQLQTLDETRLPA